MALVGSVTRAIRTAAQQIPMLGRHIGGRFVFTNAEGADTSFEARLENELAMKILAEIERTYPGHPWAIAVNRRGQIATIRLNYEDRIGRISYYGFHVRLAELELDPSMRSILQACGNLLERRRLPRCRAQDDAPDRAIENGLDMVR